MADQTLTNQSIDRNRPKPRQKIREKVPDYVAHQLVEEVLKLVGDADWNDPENVVNTIAQIMNVDLSEGVDEQVPQAVDVDRTILVPARNRKTVPYWICQSLIRVDEAKGNRYIEYQGAKYNKIDIIARNEYFRKRMDQVADLVGCTWNWRWGNARHEQHRLYQKTRPGEESWLDKCIKPLLEDDEVDGVNIKDLVMIEFKRKI